MKTLVLGEIVARGGLTSVRKGLLNYKRNLVIANAEGLSGGFGLNKDGAKLLMKFGVDILTGGEKIFYKKDIIEFLGETTRILRPLNIQAKEVPGHGAKTIDVNGEKVAIINLAGQYDMKIISLSSPFYTIDWILDKLKEQNIKTIFVVFHAQATGEKKTMFYYLDGRVTGLIGTHTKVMTADSMISNKGTAYITDNGRCGSFFSVGGLDPEIEIRKERLSKMEYSKDCFDNLQMQGVEIESVDGKAISIQAIKKDIELSEEEYKKILDKKKTSQDD